jgi:hypothetical protein
MPNSAAVAIVALPRSASDTIDAMLRKKTHDVDKAVNGAGLRQGRASARLP